MSKRAEEFGEIILGPLKWDDEYWGFLVSSRAMIAAGITSEVELPNLADATVTEKVHVPEPLARQIEISRRGIDARATSVDGRVGIAIRLSVWKLVNPAFAEIIEADMRELGWPVVEKPDPPTVH